MISLERQAKKPAYGKLSNPIRPLMSFSLISFVCVVVVVVVVPGRRFCCLNISSNLADLWMLLHKHTLQLLKEEDVYMRCTRRFYYFIYYLLWYMMLLQRIFRSCKQTFSRV
jgi:hypothetical protein